MTRLTVLYDASCGLCIHSRAWLERQPKFAELEFVAAHSAKARELFPELAGTGPDELVVVDDEGGVYRGAYAWLMCLYALVEYREWSFRLAQPRLLPLARWAFAWVSTNRKDLSRALGMAADGRFHHTGVAPCGRAETCGGASDERAR